MLTKSEEEYRNGLPCHQHVLSIEYADDHVITAPGEGVRGHKKNEVK